MNHLEQKVLELIEKCYKCKYVGELKVTKLKSGYKLILETEGPGNGGIGIALDCDSEEDFLKYVEQELISRQLTKVEYYKGVIIEPEDDERRTCK